MYVLLIAHVGPNAPTAIKRACPTRFTPLHTKRSNRIQQESRSTTFPFFSLHLCPGTWECSGIRIICSVHSGYTPPD